MNQDDRRSTHRARELRAAATPAEKRLWLALSGRQLAGAKFCRQIPIGPYFADFICRARKLVIEIDDRSHDLRWREDMARTAYLEREGYRVIRFSNEDVRCRLDGVLHVIGEALQACAARFADAGPTPPLARLPLPQAGGESARP